MVLCPRSLKWTSPHLIRGKGRIQSLTYFPKTHNFLQIFQGRKYPRLPIELSIQVTICLFSAKLNSSFIANSIDIYQEAIIFQAMYSTQESGKMINQVTVQERQAEIYKRPPLLGDMMEESRTLSCLGDIPQRKSYPSRSLKDS